MTVMVLIIDLLLFMKHLDGVLERKEVIVLLTKIMFLWI